MLLVRVKVALGLGLRLGRVGEGHATGNPAPFKKTVDHDLAQMRRHKLAIPGVASVTHEHAEAQVSAEFVPRQLFHLLVRTEAPQQQSSKSQVGALVQT